MSEYQYYEFVAIDGPLTDRHMDELRTTYQKNYDTAVRLLKDLRDAATANSRTERWKQRVAALRQQRWRKTSLMRRFDAAEFPY